MLNGENQSIFLSDDSCISSTRQNESWFKTQYMYVEVLLDQSLKVSITPGLDSITKKIHSCKL